MLVAYSRKSYFVRLLLFSRNPKHLRHRPVILSPRPAISSGKLLPDYWREMGGFPVLSDWMWGLRMLTVFNGNPILTYISGG
jgi:hypothetical protein